MMEGNHHFIRSQSPKTFSLALLKLFAAWCALGSTATLLTFLLYMLTLCAGGMSYIQVQGITASCLDILGLALNYT